MSTQKSACILKSDVEITHFLTIFSTNLSQKHKIIFLSSMKLVTIPQKLFPNPKSIFTISEKIWQRLELVWQRYNRFSIFPVFHFSSRLPICLLKRKTASEVRSLTCVWELSYLSWDKSLVTRHQCFEMFVNPEIKL